MTEASEKIFSALKKYGETFLLWLLCTAALSAVLYVYTENAFNIYTLVGSAAALGLIKAFDFFRKKKFGGFLYFGTMVTVFTAVPSLFIGKGWENWAAFIRWFFSGAQAEETAANFMLTLMPLMVYFLTSAFYYFTRIIYRSSMLALVSLIPFAIAVKAAAALPAAYCAVIASINLIFFIIDGRKKLLTGSICGGKAGNAATVYTDFALAAVLLALLAPKPSVTPYYDKFEAAVSIFSFGGSGETEYRGEYKTFSGRADELLKGESILLYILGSNEPAYMKTQVFNVYNKENGLWTDDSDTVRGNKKWQETSQLMSFEKLAAAVQKVLRQNKDNYEEGLLYDENDLLINKYPWAERFSEIADPQSYSIVYAQNFPAVYLPAPLRTAEISVSNAAVSWIARSDAGEVFTNTPMLPPNVNYTVRYFSENTLQSIMASGMSDISLEEWGDFLFDVRWETDADSEEYLVLSEFLRDQVRAEDYRDNYPTEVSAEIQALADELTAGLEHDRQKAEAIEEYFTESGFLYDLGYVPPEGMDTPEYFLFESKTGICSDFANAYVLLARAAGLTARYAEGFVPQPSAETAGTYFIYSDNAHAYPEVYIPAAGWTRFEPTPAGYIGSGGGRNSENGDNDYTAVVLTFAVFIAGFGIFILLVMLLPKVTEGIFRLRARYAESGKGVVMLYNRHIKNTENRFKKSFRAFTPEQMDSFSEEKLGQSLEPLTKPFTKVCYGGGSIGRDDFKRAYECYKEQAKAMRRMKKEKCKNKTSKTEKTEV